MYAFTNVGSIVFSIAAEPKSKLRHAIKAPLSALRGRPGKGCEESCLPPPLLQEVQNIMECKLTQLQVRRLDRGIEDQSSLKNVVAKTKPLWIWGVKLNGLRVKLGDGFNWGKLKWLRVELCEGNVVFEA
eukprot:2190877-Amphidinium_carterae.1